LWEEEVVGERRLIRIEEMEKQSKKTDLEIRGMQW
jgi:hypothetical protein